MAYFASAIMKIRLIKRVHFESFMNFSAGERGAGALSSDDHPPVINLSPGCTIVTP
jgi:hypothetical protein